MNKASVILLFSLALILVSGCEKQVNRPYYQISGSTMGTTYNITVVATPSEATVDKAFLPLASQQEIKQKVDELLLEVNQQMSTYIPDSELMRFNRSALGSEQALSLPLFEVLSLAESIYQQSQGAFDVTVGPAVNLWGFGSDNRAYNPDFKGPSEAEVASTLLSVGQSNLTLTEGVGGGFAVRSKDVFVDLSAIAKGYGVDAVADLLEAEGVEHYLVEIGGELRLKGQSPKSRHWRIGIERPQPMGFEGMDATQKSVSQAISLTDVAMATSGDYRNYFEAEGVRYSHTIDPRTGYPVKHKLASVTVLAETSAQADAWATALSVLGEKQGYEVAKEQGIAAFFLVKADNGFVELATEPFRPYID